MIEKMKKFTFLLTHGEYEGFLDKIQELGVVHVEELQQGATSPQLGQAMELATRYQAAQQMLATAAKTYLPDENAKPVAVASAPEELLSRIEAMQQEENKLLHDIDSVGKSIARLEPWGEFDMQTVRKIEKATGLRVHFFRCGNKSFRKDWAADYFAIPVNEYEKSIYFVTFSPQCPDIAAEQIFLPAESLNHFRTSLQQLQGRLNDLRQEYLQINNAQKGLLDEGLADARNEVSLSHVRLCHEDVAGNALRLMIGWVRADYTTPLVDYLEQSHIFYQMENPAFEDDVPVQITNNAYSRLFEPILKMYSLPNYNDLDPTTFFAPFFMLFFGLCMGDAGYGLLIFLVGLYLALKGGDDVKPYGRLGAWLGGTTVVCGLLTGTVFGVDLSVQDWSFIQPVKPYFLNDNGVGQIFGYSPMMVISVLIGFIQVLLGMILKGCKAIKNYGWPYAVGTFSWVVALIVAIVLYGMPACGVELPAVCQYILTGLLGVSCLGIFLYNDPASYKRPVLGLLGNIGSGLWASYGMATGLLGDLLSYIRLFALGLTGGVLGGVFNSLAMDMTATMPIAARIPVMVIILLAGHGVTFALSMISAFVHPMRLTFVEFFKNADFSGGGKAYNPFRNLRINK